MNGPSCGLWCATAQNYPANDDTALVASPSIDAANPSKSGQKIEFIGVSMNESLVA